MINGRQVKDLSVFCLARVVRVTFGWHWTMGQKMDLIEAEEIALRAYRKHGKK